MKTLADEFAALEVKLPLVIGDSKDVTFDANRRYANLIGDAAPLAVVAVNFHDRLVAALYRRAVECCPGSDPEVCWQCELDLKLLTDIAVARQEGADG